MLLVAILGGAALLVALLLGSIAAPQMRVWPLPDPEGPAWWTRRFLNRLCGAGIAVLSLGVLVLAGLERHTWPVAFPGSVVLGSLVGALGAVLGGSGYRTLGPAQSLGQSGSLVSSGPYRFSRNPQYVGAAALLLGFSTALGSGQALLAAVACSTWFIIAPFAEEPWLREKLGLSYSTYLASAPRYLGLPSRPTRAA